MPDIYGDRDPREFPAYSLADAAYYLKVSPATLRHWACGSLHPTANGPRRSQPVIVPARRKPLVLSFYNLLEAHVLRALRTRDEIPLQRIRPALKFVERELSMPHPLVHARFETDGLDLFVERYGAKINASQGGRVEVRAAVADMLQRIQWDAGGVASGFYLWSRDPLEAKKVIVDPRVSFGRAVLRDTAVPITILAERSRAGDAVEAIARDYGLSDDDVKYALRWEPLVQAA